MASTTIVTLFTTLAQVSFTVSGLMAVAIAGDSKRRDYWFGHEARSLFVYKSFLLLLLPGFVSIGGLIPSASKVPSWVFATLFLGLLYLVLAITFRFRRKKLVEPAEFKRLEKKYFGANSELGFYGFAILFIGVAGGVWAYSVSSAYSMAETGLGTILFLSAMSGAVVSVGMLRSTEQYSKISNETNAIEIPKKDLVNEGKTTGSYVIISLLIAIIAFLVGVFIRNEDR